MYVNLKVNEGVDPSPSLSPMKQFEAGYSTERGDEPESIINITKIKF
jgi:hypothetical protein